MESLPTPIRTPKAHRGLDSREVSGDSVKRALLSSSDGHRNVIVIELESFARAMGLDPDALDRLRVGGLIDPAR